MQVEVEFGHSGVVATPLGLGANAVGGYNLFPQLNDEQGLRTCLESFQEYSQEG